MAGGGVPSSSEIRGVAQDVLRELLGSSPDPREERRGLSRPLISQAEVRAARQRGETTIVVPAGAIVTPLAHDLAVDSKIEIRVEGAPEANRGAAPDPEDGGPAPLAQGGPVAIGSDHGGFELKQALSAYLKELGVAVQDVGTHAKQSCDYPDYAAAVAKQVALGQASWGVFIDGAGIGSCMAANKVPGVLAATVHDVRTAKNSREHNGANMVCLGSVGLTADAAKQILHAWLTTETGGGRHARRVNKIRAIEASFVK